MQSIGLKGLGQDSPIDGAAAIAALHVAQDLLSDAAKPLDKVLVASLVQKWLMDRLITNKVNVTSGSQAEQFVLLADGSYNPQPGSTSRLSLSDGAYTLKYKDATTLYFDAAGNIATWVAPSRVTASFTGPHLCDPAPLSSPTATTHRTAAPNTRLLPTRTELAASIPENLASGPQSELEFNATMVLREWRAGRLKNP
ncbi:MAG: hypothetical protein AB7F22_36755 [Reyranella sp.]|uniref:hypothetical protein n=1 Tax=Reyranella sp. TaxID=1929291 RepID=UPI003D1303A7